MKSNTILDKIVIKKEQRLRARKKQLPFEELRRQANESSRMPLDFFGHIKRDGKLSIIAEVKKASPSKGLIRENFLPMDIARDYLNSNVQAMSILTEEDFFQGSATYLQNIRTISTLPLLRKDFLFDPYQMYEAFCMGADAVLLIAAILENAQMEALLKICTQLGLQALIEVHNKNELDRVLALDAPVSIIGVNNRDLHTFEEDLQTTKHLIDAIPSTCCIVSESGIRTHKDLADVFGWGAHGVLIGEALMRSDDIPAAVAGLRQNVQ